MDEQGFANLLQCAAVAIFGSKPQLKAEPLRAPEVDPAIVPGIRLRCGADPVVARPAELRGADAVLPRQLMPQLRGVATRLER